MDSLPEPAGQGRDTRVPRPVETTGLRGAQDGRSLDVWHAAAAAGGAWGAVEVTVGVFLHSLGLPGTGFVLAWLEAAFLTAVWSMLRRRSVVALAALTAGAMRFLVPTGSLLGPALAISAQGTLVALGLTLPGPIGAAVGGGLALSWTVIQAVVSGLVYYGLDLARLYGFVASGLARLLGLSGVGTGVGVLLGVVFCVGALAGLFGLFVGRRARALAGRADGAPAALGLEDTEGTDVPSVDRGAPERAGGGPPVWVWLPALGSIAVLWTGSLLWHSFVLVALIGAVAAWNARILRRIANVRFWLVTGLVAVAAALVSMGWHRADPSWRWWAGLTAAGLMVTRVALLTVGSVVGERWFRARGVGAKMVRFGRFGQGLAHAWRMVPEAAARVRRLGGTRGATGFLEAAARYVAWAVSVSGWTGGETS